MSDHPGKKAELDKDGIAYDFEKAELDKEGVSLSDEPGAEEAVQGETQQTASAAAAVSKPSTKRKTILIASIASGLLVAFISVGILTHYLTKKPQVEIPVTYKKPVSSPGLDSTEGDILLDPFMVLYNSRKTKESGVLLAQLSLQANPETAYNIGSRMYDIRNLIFQRLSSNADVYSKEELAAIIRDDLKGLNVNNVVFVEFDKR